MRRIRIYIKSNEGNFLKLALSLLTLQILARLPYFNIAFNARSNFLIMLVLAVLFFRLGEKGFLFFALVAVLAGAFLAALGYPGFTEELGNIFYGLLIIWFLSSFMKNLKAVEEKSD